MTTSDLQRLQKSYDMPVANGICTQEVDHPDSLAPNCTKVTKEDRLFFKGNPIETHDKDYYSVPQLLSMVGANWVVIPKQLERPDINRTYPEQINWYQSDNNDLLGKFGSSRKPLNPELFIQSFRDFTRLSEKEISMDVIGFDPVSKILYAASKLTDHNDNLQHVGEETDHWMVSTVNYMKPQSIQTFVWHNVLVCTNGMTQPVKNHLQYLSHRKERTFDDLLPYYKGSLEIVKNYSEIRDRLIHAPISPETARRIIMEVFKDEEGLKNPTQESNSQNARRVEAIFLHDLIGGDQATRQGNAYGLQQAFTQFTSHSLEDKGGRKTKSEDHRFSQKLGGELSRLDNRATQIIREAVGV